MRNAVLADTLYLPKNQINLEKVKKDLTIQDFNYVTGDTLVLRLYEEDYEYLYVPRQYGLAHIRAKSFSFDDETSLGQELGTDINSIRLHDYQEPFTAEIVRKFEKYHDVVAQAGTGKGKTVMALEVAKRLGRTTLVIVDQDMIRDQWIRRITQFWGIPKEEIGSIQGKVVDYEGRSIVVAMIQTVYGKEYPQELYDYFGTVICDECYSADTEILTDKGWTLLPELSLEDRVATWSVDGKVHFCTPSRRIKKRYLGDMIHVIGGQTDMLLTPKHEQPVRRLSTKTGTRVFTAARVVAEDLVFNANVCIPVAGVADGKILTCMDRFYIATQADGYICPQSNQEYTKVQFGFSKERKIIEFLSLMEETGLSFTEGKVCLGCGNVRNVRRFFVRAPKHISKKFEDWIDLSFIGEKYIDAFVEEILKWDGYATDKIMYYSTVDKDNADFVQAMCAIGGWTTNRGVQEDTRSSMYSDVHRLTFKKNSYRNTSALRKNRVHYDGYVYCVTVDTGNVITRRNNNVTVSGNCHTLGSEQFSRVFNRLTSRYRLGISATPDRGDALQKTLDSHLGKVKVQLGDQHKDSILRYIRYGGVISHGANVSRKTGGYLSELVSDSGRNWVIARALMSLYEKDRHILAVSDRIEHLEELMVICGYLGMREEDMGLVAGYCNKWMYAKDPSPKSKPKHVHKGAEYTPVSLQLVSKRAKKDVLTERKDNSKVIFATYGMFTKAVDVPRLSVGIDCTPRSKATQVHGRILRIMEGKPIPIWVTLWDYNSYKASHQFLRRLDEYETSNVEVFEWNLDKGVRSKNLDNLRKSIHGDVIWLKSKSITTFADGNNIIMD